MDSRGKGESGGTVDDWKTRWFEDLDTAFNFLVSQPGVDRNVIGVGGAGGLGVESAVETARRHSSEVKSLVLLSGETEPAQLQFLHQNSRLPGLFVYSDDDEYPPTQREMEWLVTTLIKTPGHAPADPLAAAPILMDVEFRGGVTRATRALLEARQEDPEVQLWPEVSMTSVGENLDREGNFRSGIEVFKLNLLAYPSSADVYENIAEAYLGAGQDDLARQSAEKALALLDMHGLPASSWTDTEQYRGEIRAGAEGVVRKLKEEKR